MAVRLQLERRDARGAAAASRRANRIDLWTLRTSYGDARLGIVHMHTRMHTYIHIQLYKG